MRIQDTPAASLSQSPETNFWDWANTIPWYGFVAIVAIVVGGAIAITSLVIEHKERMAGLKDAGDRRPE